MPQIIPLDFLSAGQAGRVVDVDGEQEFVMRLCEVGLRPGVDVQVLQPGNPCIVSVGGSRLSLRGDRLAAVMVEALP